MIIACDGVAAGTELSAIVDAVIEAVASLLVIGDEDDVYSVKVSHIASVTIWPSNVVRTCSGFMQIVWDLTVQLCRVQGQHCFS